MTATLQPGSGLTKQSAELGRVPFLPASTPARTRPDTAKPPGLCDASGGLAELGLPTRMLLAIPELGSFDQEELNDNPVLNELYPVPLIGALLLARRLITREQLDACLLLQAQSHADLPIGQILVQHGYISQVALDRTLGIQSDMRSSLEDLNHLAPRPGFEPGA
jgi:hypothetical protein